MVKKRNVLFVLHQLTHGGVQHALINVLNHVDYEKNNVTLLILRDRLELVDEINPKVNIIVCRDNNRYDRLIPALFYDYFGRICRILGLKKEAERLSEKEAQYVYNKRYSYIYDHYTKALPEYDVAVSYIHGYPATVVAKYIKAKRKIMFYHASVDEVHNAHKGFIENYDRIIGINQPVADVVAASYPEMASKIGVLPLFVNASEVREKADQEDVVLSGKVNIVSCGRLSSEKGYDLAIDAAALLKKKKMEFCWYIVGDGPDSEALERRIKNAGLEAFVTITGFKKNPYLYMKAGDIFVQPSYLESYGLTIEEAKILCRPVVATKTLGGKYLICHEQNGLLADINAQDIAVQIERLIKDQELYRTITEKLKCVDYTLAEKQYAEGIEKLLSGC